MQNSEAAPTTPAPVSFAQRFATLLIVTLPFFAVLLAIVLAWGRGVGWLEVGLLAGMYLATGIGVTAGFHRLFTHRSFETVAPVRFLFGVLGSMAIEGPVLEWVATHRQHHQHSDSEQDPHSPNLHGGGVRGVLVGFFHGHMGWIFSDHRPDVARYAPDLHADPVLRFVNAWFPLWAVLGLLIPAAIGGLVAGTWTGAALGFLWGGLVRVFVIHHATWSINSVCHIWGGRPFDADDLSRNNAIFGLLGLGEGWHNNHHAFPHSARHGLFWWQVDLSYMLIWLASKLGIVWRVRLPSERSIAARRRAVPAETAPAICADPPPSAIPIGDAL